MSGTVARRRVVVIGSASVGLYAVAVARALGVPCTYVDNVDARLQVAERFGARIISSLPDGRSFGEFAVSASCMYRRGIRLVTGRSSTRDDLPAVLDLIQQNRLKPGLIGASVIKVDDAPRALGGALSHKTVIDMV